MKKTKTYIIKNCLDCPFSYTEYDDYALNLDTMEICNLAVNLNINDHFINVYNRIDEENIKHKIPKWCPLKKESLLLKLKN